MWRFSVVRSLASFMNEVAKYQLADVAGFLIFLIGARGSESHQRRAVSYLVLLLPFRVTNVKQAKRDIGENYVQTMQYRVQITTAKRLQVMEGFHCNM